MESSKHIDILAFDLLGQLKEGKPIASISSQWEHFHFEQKEHLASTIFEEAKHLILQGHDFAFNAFDLVRRIAPQSANLHFKQGVFLFDYGIHKSNDQYLYLAQKHIEQALNLKNESIDAWAIWGDICVHLGLINKDIESFHKGDEKYQKAYDLSKDDPKFLRKFLWDWALCWYYIGKHSGEAVDIKKSIELFERAAAHDSQRENFWHDFGNAYVAMGLLISDERFLQKALRCFQKALEIKPSYYRCWLSCANTFHKIYQMTYKDEDFTQAYSAYSKAADIQQDHVELWMNWGQLFLQMGIVKEESKHLQMAITKFEKAIELDAECYLAHAAISEAYSTLGHLNGDLEQLKIGEQKIKNAFQLTNEEAHLYYCKGYSSYMLGQYFDDTSYYLMAIQSYKCALELKPNHFHAHFGLGRCKLALGKTHQDEEYYLAAHKYFRAASEHSQSYPDLWNQWGVVHLSLSELLDDPENIRQAVEKFERALAFYQGQKPPATLLFNYGCALDFLGNYSDDLSDYSKAAEILELLLENYSGYECVYYNLALVYSHLAELYSDTDYYCKALENFHRASQEDNEDSLIWLNWAVTLMQYALLIKEPLQQEFYSTLLTDSEKKLRQALALGEQEAYFHLACLYSMKSSPMEALHFLQLSQAKGSMPDSEELMFEPRLEALRSYEPFHSFIQSSPIKERLEDN